MAIILGGMVLVQTGHGSAKPVAVIAEEEEREEAA
jgi:hypothetical protein